MESVNFVATTFFNHNYHFRIILHSEYFSFEFKNEGKTPALIQGVQTSCGCTTANKPEEPVKPGKKSVISVKYDTKRVGNFTKTITVTSNVSEPIVLTIRGTVLSQDTKTN